VADRPGPLRAAAWALGAVLVGGAASGCGVVQEEETCAPGEQCAAWLADVAAEAERTVGVAEVLEVTYFGNIDSPAGVWLSVTADVTDADEARGLASDLVAVARDGDFSETEQGDPRSVAVQVRPTQEQVELAQARRTLTPTEEAGTAPASLGAASDVLAGALGAGAGADLALDDVRRVDAERTDFGDDHAGADVVVEVSTDEVAEGDDDVETWLDVVVDAAEEAGLLDLGRVRVLLDHRRVQWFAFRYDVADGVLEESEARDSRFAGG